MQKLCQTLMKEHTLSVLKNFLVHKILAEEYKAFLERLKNPKSAQVTTQLPDRKSSYGKRA